MRSKKNSCLLALSLSLSLLLVSDSLSTFLNRQSDDSGFHSKTTGMCFECFPVPLANFVWEYFFFLLTNAQISDILFLRIKSDF